MRVIGDPWHAFPRLPQIACVDTAVHRQMPRVAHAATDHFIDTSRIVVRVMATNEDLVIARRTHNLIEEGAMHGDHV